MAYIFNIVNTEHEKIAAAAFFYQPYFADHSIAVSAQPYIQIDEVGLGHWRLTQYAISPILHSICLNTLLTMF